MICMESLIKESPQFVIFVDRFEGDYAICEFPDGDMKDILISFFKEGVKERERFVVNYDENDKLVYISKLLLLPGKSNVKKLPSKLVRFA